MYQITLYDEETNENIDYPIDSRDLTIDDGSNEDQGPEKYFSYQGCKSCNQHHGRILGSDVTDCKIYVNGNFSDYYEIPLCHDCIYRHHYGQESIDE